MASFAWAARASRPLAAAVGAVAGASLAPRRPTYAEGDGFVKVQCVQNLPHTHNTRKITLSGLDAGTNSVVNVLVRAPLGDDNANITRVYNPLSLPHDGTVTLLVKKYENAKMGAHLHELKPGDSIEMKGPNQQWEYVPHKYTDYVMIAGGTGITPLIQAARDILQRGSANVTMIVANKTSSDKLLAQEMLEMERKYPDRFHVHHIIESGVGTVADKHLLNRLIPPHSAKVMVMVCGRPAMTAAVAGKKGKDGAQGEVGGVLAELGYSSEQVWKM